MANSKKNQRSITRNPEQHAFAIAQAVDTAWQKANNSGRRDVPLSVAATLALVGQRDPNGPDLGDQFRALTADEFAEISRQIWTQLVNARPDLTHLVYPLMQWLFTDPEPALRQAARSTAEAALDAGQLQLTGTDARYDADLLGIVLTLLKSRTAVGANAQVYTPNSIASILAHLNTPEEHTSVQDPAVGSGGLFRAAAEAMREKGRDPTTVTWAGCDIDELAIAACAVNSILWGLGTRMLLYVGDTLAEGDWTTRAHQQRAEILRVAEAVRRDKQMIAAVRMAQHLTELVTDDMPEQERPAPE
ncbi:hypothetical protein FHU38_000877 [Saccharomonospora amisosensis]|uniref:site-specific DNA-methyltransferase (adenine-specific) n=1 Tax=Saccharomonospora amisosensis TaxID=1128677 RepID=A0A7X5UM30_9PSEU|nr:N-6 DNA methylase [Saccharomonospora amisosensis]NIJ10533.1 hypothetical protein [Saccharomonospora amisosensis]